MRGTYWKLKDDGAEWRCRECGQLKPHSQVILFENKAAVRTYLLCLDCVDADWLRDAQCLGTR